MTASAVLKPLSTELVRASAGLNLCHENAAELYEKRPQLDFIQIHPEHIIQEAGRSGVLVSGGFAPGIQLGTWT